MTKNTESVIFRSVEVNQNLLIDYKQYLIFIPTNRKNENGKIEKIPCLFQRYPKSKNILIIFHCNGVNMFNLFPYFRNLGENNKINVLFPEYPGYSIYESPASTKKSLEDSLIIYDYILKNVKNITENNIYILGRSLGTGLAVYLSSQRNPAGVFLISPYTTFGEVDKIHTKELYKDLSRHLRSIDYIDKVKCPLFIIHGKKDKLIDYHESIKLYEKYNGKNKEIKLIEEMDHNDVNYFDLEKYITNFVNKYCPLDNIENDEENEFNFVDKELYIPSDKIRKKIYSIENKDYYFEYLY